jgi:predicted acyl esterase
MDVVDAGQDAGEDAGEDAGQDAGEDAGQDAGPDGTDEPMDAGADEEPDAHTGDGDDSGPACGTERVRLDIGIPTLDGYELSALLDRPAQENCPLPTILLQTPYSKESAWTLFLSEERPDRPLFASPHYNFVVVDWRGFHGSSGLPHPGDGAWATQDSWDTVEWIAAQPWSDGQVGTWGVSALCVAQYRTAIGPVANAQHPDFADGPPPHLVAMVPIMCPLRPGYRQLYPGGALRHEAVVSLDVLGYGVRLHYENNPRQNWLWDLVDESMDTTRIRVPALVVSGWWDLYPKQVVEAWEEIRTSSDPSVRTQHRLLIGPWFHFACGGAVSEGALRPLTDGEKVYMDNERRIDIDSLAFFDHYLRGIQNDVPGWAPVRYHHEGAGWLDADQWPPSGGTTQTLYLDAQGELVESPPAGGSLTFPYDPADPSPTIGGPSLSPYNCVGHPNPLACTLTPDEERILLHGPTSQAALLDRQDQLTFMTGVLTEPLVIRGGLRLFADVSTDGADTDIAVRILDVDETGDPLLIGEGIQRLSGRDGDRTYSEVVPGQRYSLVVDLVKDFAITIAPGHRLGVMVTGSNWPLFARNPADGAVFMRSDVLPATNETFSYGWPPVEVDMKGDGTPVVNTLFLDGNTRIEFGTVE